MGAAAILCVIVTLTLLGSCPQMVLSAIICPPSLQQVPYPTPLLLLLTNTVISRATNTGSDVTRGGKGRNPTGEAKTSGRTRTNITPALAAATVGHTAGQPSPPDLPYTPFDVHECMGSRRPSQRTGGREGRADLRFQPVAATSDPLSARAACLLPRLSHRASRHDRGGGPPAGDAARLQPHVH